MAPSVHFFFCFLFLSIQSFFRLPRHIGLPRPGLPRPCPYTFSTVTTPQGYHALGYHAPTRTYSHGYHTVRLPRRLDSLYTKATTPHGLTRPSISRRYRLPHLSSSISIPNFPREIPPLLASSPSTRAGSTSHSTR